MIDPELNVKVVDKIKESNTEAKPQLTGLYFRLMELYVAEDKLKKGNLVLNGKRNTKISDYTEKVSSIAGGKTELDSSNLGELSEFFSEAEVGQVAAKKAYKLDDYWLKSLQASEALGGFIMPEDEPLLKSLTNISLSMSDTTDDYSLTFHFSQNDYITNERLTLKVEVDKDDDTKKITSDDISWKDDKCLTEKTVTKTQTNKKTKKKREIQKKQKQESFFHIFKTRNVEDDDEEEEELEDEDAMGMFYDAGSIGDALSVYKYMISKYHGASYFGAEIPDYKFDDGYGAEDSDEEDDQDDEDEDRDDAPKKSKKPKAVAPAKGPGQEECKKQ